MPKVINVSKEPYEFTFNSGNYGPIMPGEIKEYPAEVAAHAVKRSQVIDPDFGETVTHRIAYLDSVDKSEVAQIATYECPFVMTNQCKQKAFKTVDELRAHMETHWSTKQAEPEKTQFANSKR